MLIVISVYLCFCHQFEQLLVLKISGVMDGYNYYINEWIMNGHEDDENEDDGRAQESYELASQLPSVPSRNIVSPPQPCHTSPQTGWKWVQELLGGHDKRIYDALRMSKDCFMSLCHALHNNYGLTNEPQEIHYIESVAIFLYIIAQGSSNRGAQERFQHSGSTISKHFRKVLRAGERMASDIIHPTHNGAVPEAIQRSAMYYPYFKDCIGALDGTHVNACVPPEAITFIGRSGTATQNILAVCDFDMCFTHVSAGWEGSMHDTKVLNNVLNNNIDNFPRPPEGEDKYYLVDSGYPNMKGFLAPYKGGGLRYHQPDFRRGDPPRNEEEQFNKVHSSLRSIIERTFGVWKNRWKILQAMPQYPFKLQPSIVGVSMAIHNFIRRHDRQDPIFLDFIRTGAGFINNDDDIEENTTTQMHGDAYMNSLRDEIRDQLCRT